MKMTNMDFFFLAPPLISPSGCGFAVIQLGLDFSETMILRLECWRANDYLKFWFEELAAMLVSEQRNVGLLPNGVYQDGRGREYFLERWNVYKLGSEFVFRDKTVVADDDVGYSSSKVDKDDWWNLIGEYEDGVSQVGDDGEVYSVAEWRVSASAVADWCRKYSCVFAQMDSADSDPVFKW